MKAGQVRVAAHDGGDRAGAPQQLPTHLHLPAWGSPPGGLGYPGHACGLPARALALQGVAALAALLLVLWLPPLFFSSGAPQYAVPSLVVSRTIAKAILRRPECFAEARNPGVLEARHGQPAAAAPLQ
jgi:hypothetical protein